MPSHRAPVSGRTRGRGSSRPAQRGLRRPGRSRGPAAAGRPRRGQVEGPPRRPRITGRALVLVLVAGMLAVSYASSLRAFLAQRSQLADLRAGIASSRADLAQLVREQRRWKDPAYVEAQARQRFGWVMPGEISYQVIGRNGKPLAPRDTLTDPRSVTAPPQPPWWRTAWGTVVAAGHPERVPRPGERIRPDRNGSGR